MSTKAWWVHTKKNPEALRAWTELHKAGMDKFHANFDQHERWRHAISEGMKQWWSHTNGDPVALSIWKEAHKAGLDAFHADPVKHKRWRDAISEGMKSWWSHTKGDPEALLYVLGLTRSYTRRGWTSTRNPCLKKSPRLLIFVFV